MAYQNLFEQLQETCDFIALEDDMNQIINALEKDLIEQGQTLPLVNVTLGNVSNSCDYCERPVGEILNICEGCKSCSEH
jgi:hypothetical protein